MKTLNYTYCNSNWSFSTRAGFVCEKFKDLDW